MLEAGLITPVLFLLLSGVVDLGRAFYFADIAANAARAGSQYGILSSVNAGCRFSGQPELLLPGFSRSSLGL